MKLQSTITFLLALSNVYGFIAYDCSGPKLNITSFNSLHIDKCQEQPPPRTIELPRIKLLQRAEVRTIIYKACFISVDYIITKCSTFNDAQAVEGGFFSEIIMLGHAQCSQIHQRLVYNFPNGGIVLGLKINQTTYVTHTLAGSIDRDGNCQGSTFASDRGSWKKVIVQGNYKIHLSEGIANAISKDNELVLPTGTKLKLSELYGLDTHKGEIIWNNNQFHHSCDVQDFDVLYDGPATVMISEPPHSTSEETQTFLVETQNIVFALKKIKKTFACEIPVILTEHPQLFILMDISFMNHFTIKNIIPQNTDLMAYVNTKFVYIENFLKTTLISLYSDLVKKQCELERKILLQQLSLATYSLSEFAYSMGEGPGYTALRAGEIIYLLKCKPVDVEIARHTSCFNELPIKYNNKTHFMAPKTHTLQTYGTEMDCNELLPPAFLLDGEWFGFAPTPREIKVPQTLRPSTTWTWTYKSPEALMIAGIYTQDIMTALQKHLLFPQEIESAQRNIARQSMGYNFVDQGLRLKSLLDEDTIGKMVENKLQRMWGWFTSFGTFISGLLGIFVIWRAFITAINTGLNISILYQTFGWSIKLLAGIFTSLTQYVMHKAHNKQLYKEVSNPISKSPNTTLTEIQNKSSSQHYPNIRTISL